MKRWMIAGASLLALAVWGRSAFENAGHWLVTEDELEPASAIAVLGGKMPFRAREAAELYKEGWAKTIWLPGLEKPAEHEPIIRMGFSPADPDLYKKVLARYGVPAEAVRFLRPHAVRNTRDEIAILKETKAAEGGGRIIIVTSPWHTRRVKALWGISGGLTVRYTRHEPVSLHFDRWWEKKEESERVKREIGGIVDAWLGSPMRLLGR